MEILKSPAGCDPVIGVNEHLDTATEEMDAAIAVIEDDCRKATMAALAEIPSSLTGKPFTNAVKRVCQINAPGAQIGYNFLLNERNFLKTAAVEICCPESGFHVWARTTDEAVALWNRAVEKLPTMEACCLDPANQVTKRTEAGFPVARCAVCNRRHVPFTEHANA